MTCFSPVLRLLLNPEKCVLRQIKHPKANRAIDILIAAD